MSSRRASSLVQKWIPFEMVVDTTIAGDSGVGNFRIDTDSANGYRYKVEWGDGSVSAITSSSDVTHTYPSGGTYTVKISGRFDSFQYNNSNEADKIIQINSWGNIAWKEFVAAFRGCSNLTAITTDAPILEHLKNHNISSSSSLANLWYGCTNLDGAFMDNWDFTQATNTGGMFQDCTNFNNGGSASISGWTMSGVTSMGSMFRNADSFNQPIGAWDVSNVTNMSTMFAQNSGFNQDIGNWDVSKVTNFFYFAWTSNFNNGGSPSISGWTFSPSLTQLNGLWYQSAFNQNINAWDVSNITNMNQLFAISPFNQPLDTWDVSNVTDMTRMFQSCTAFDQDISNWNVGKVQDFDLTFFNCTNFNNSGSTAISGWTTSAATTFQSMFALASSFNQPIGSWDVSNVINFFECFNFANSFNQDIGNWDVSKGQDFGEMFQSAANFNNGGSPSISGWTTSAATSMISMFLAANSFNQPIGSWDVSNVQNMSDMFRTNTIFNQPLGNWNVSSVTNMHGMFEGDNTNETVFNKDIGSWDVSNVTDMSNMFDHTSSGSPPLGAFNNGGSPSISGWTVSAVTNMSSMFRNTPFDQPIGAWDVSNVTNMSNMFDLSSMSTANYNDVLTGWTGWNAGSATTTLQTGVTLGADGLTYSTGTTAEDARNYLITGLTWTINGDSGV
jgi:surface protein